MALILALAGLNSGNRALADVDPPGCTGNGAQVTFSTYRADGVTSIGGNNTVVLGEIIKYQATLSYAGQPRCAFEGGTWTVTLPNGQVIGLGPVPRIGDPSTGTGAKPSVTSALIPYTVSSA